MKNKINELKNNLMNLVSNSGLYSSNISGFKYSRRNAPTDLQYCFYRPMVFIVLQGKKQAIIGSEQYDYKAGDCIATSIDMPTAGQIIEATQEKPFLTLILELNNSIIAELVSQMQDTNKNETIAKSVEVMNAEYDLLDAFSRLLELERNPERQKIMAPMIIKEIHYILLTSPFGHILKSVNTKGTPANQIANAINWLKNNYRQPLKIDELSKKFNMAESSFYRHFNRITTLSPLQYQKQLRLQEAQRLMLSENLKASDVAYNVGYESVSQFNREYKRMFGTPPKTNIKQFRTAG